MKNGMKIAVLALVATSVGTLALPAAHAAESYGRGYVYDNRFNHNRYYPRPGFSISVLPPGYVSVPWRGSSYYYYGGVWYRPYGPRFQVIEPPRGILVPQLPPGYTTVWIGGTPYYYAGGAYYLWEPNQGGYIVTTVPHGAEAAATTSAPAGDEMFAYPKNGQSEAQQSKDRYECYDWARGQTGYDPTQPAGGVSPAQAESKRSDYQRAQKACLDARGYSVR